MIGTGMYLPDYFSQRPKAPAASSSSGMDTYPASIAQSASDYDDIMKRYRAMLDAGPDSQYGNLVEQYTKLGDQQYTPTPVSYQRSPDLGGAISNLSDLSKTGGYSDADIANLRARGISPIRSVYANAMQNITRQKALQGGYSPNYTASMAKLARELSSQIADQTTNVNAGIAQNVAQNKLSIAPQYADVAQRETGAMTDVASQNANAQNSAAQFNIANKSNALGALANLYSGQQGRTASGLSGMTSLYGTTPANPALYGQQANQAANLELQKKQLNQNANTALINAYPKSARF